MGGAFVVSSTIFGSGALIVQSGRAAQFQVGLIMIMIGAVGLAFIGWFYAVNGKESFFRRRAHPREPALQA